jgi:hypothetical protein
MRTRSEIEAAVKKLTVAEAHEVAIWLENYLAQQTPAIQPTSDRPRPDYEARRRTIFGDRVLPNMVILGREQERW